MNNILDDPKIIESINAENIISNLRSEQQELIYAILDSYNIAQK